MSNHRTANKKLEVIILKLVEANLEIPLERLNQFALIHEML